MCLTFHILKNFNKITAVIVDDEKKSREKALDIIKSNFNNINVEIAIDVKSGIEKINTVKPQIVFLDIDMPDGTGFDLLKGIKFYDFKVVFITAHQEHAINAIKFSALDYILKPYSPDELINSIKNAINKIEAENNRIKIETFISNFQEINNKPKKLVLNTSDNIYIIDIDDIIRCKSDNNYTIFYLLDNKTITMSKTLKEYENILPDNYFIRVHRSHLINIQHLEKFEKRNSGQIILKDKSIVPVSVRKKEQLLQMLAKL